MNENETNDVNDRAHNNFLTVEHFAELRENGPVNVFKIGMSVAFLHDDDENVTIYFGRLSGSEYRGDKGMRYKLVTREGHKWRNIDPAHLAAI